jgi:hypothetical protein
MMKKVFTIYKQVNQYVEMIFLYLYPTKTIFLYFAYTSGILMNIFKNSATVMRLK